MKCKLFLLVMGLVALLAMGSSLPVGATALPANGLIAYSVPRRERSEL